MFTILRPIHPLDAEARRIVYREFIKGHGELTAISVGCHSDMIMLQTVPETEEGVAILLATGEGAKQVVFPRHRHLAGEENICLEGVYAEIVPDGTEVDDLFEGSTTLAGFQAAHPGVVEVHREGGQTRLHLAPGARWTFEKDSQHKPFGWTSPDGFLMAQIYWPGPNELLE